MKRFFFKLLVITLSVALYSCSVDEMNTLNPEFKYSFQRAGRDYALAGEAIQVILTGEADYCTLYDGTTGHVYGDSAATGTDFNTADSLSITYNKAGTYQTTVVFTSIGKFSTEIKRIVKTIPVVVVDNRNSFSEFLINNVYGLIKPDNTIEVSLPNSISLTNLKPVFTLTSADAKVFVNGNQQATGITANDFTNPLTYTVKSVSGIEKQYVVKIITYQASSEKKITKLSLANDAKYGNGEVAEINEATRTITLLTNYGTSLSRVILNIESSYASKVYINSSTIAYPDRTYTNISGTGIDPLQSIRVVAQDNSETVYQVNVSSQAAVTAFTFKGLVPEPESIIDAVNKTITVKVLKGTDITKLTAKWTGSVGKVTIGTVVQTNGTTVNNFTNPITYTFYKGSAAWDRYTVNVSILQ